MQRERRCDNCTFSTFAGGRGRPRLICRQEKGCEGRWKSHDLLEKCENFYASRAGRGESCGPRLIPLTRGKFAVVDAEDYAELSKFMWLADEGKSTYYAVRRKNAKEVLKMHRVIMKAPAGLVVDHIDHDGLNNRRSNLRLATLAENCQNKRGSRNKVSRYKGVSRRKGGKKWVAEIEANKVRHNLGHFESEVEAAKAYDEAAKRLHGEFAVLNLADDRGQRAEGRGQKSEDRGQKSEVRGQKSEVRGQKTDGRSQKSEGRRQKSEVRRQKTEGPEVSCGTQRAKVM